MNFDLKDTKTQIMLLLIIAIAGAWYAFINYSLSPANEVIKEKQKELDELQQKYSLAKRIADRREEAEQELARLEKQWEEAQKKLPSQRQIEQLLVQLNNMGMDRGVKFEKFSPDPPRPPKGFYRENIINISVKGDYHQLAYFFSDIANLTRIVKVDKVTISEAKSSQEDKGTIQAQFQAIAYAFVEQRGGANSAK